MSLDFPIEVKNLSKCYHVYDRPRDRLLQMLYRNRKSLYREFWALRNISFEIKKGETVGIIGRNGSGKSTLLQLICGTLNPSEGTVLTNGRIAALLELGSGFNPEFTGRENVFMNAAVLGVKKEEVEAQFSKIESFAEIGDFINQPVKHYSSGMMLRLAFAVQAMLEPDILIVDEALSVGDEKFQRKCFSRIEELKKQGTSILFVSHSGPQVIELCDRAVLLEKGENLLIGQPAEVVRFYQRMIYASPEDQLNLINDLKKGKRVAKIEPIPTPKTENEKKSDSHFDEEFDPSLIPSSTIEYPDQGARIYDFQIFNKEGKRVNVLKAGNIYRFTYKGHFTKSLVRVNFGIHIRSISGVVITGQRFPENGHFIELAHSGEKFNMTFEFNLLFLPDTYFFGGGVWSADPICANRVVDAAMFRVLPNRKQRSGGYCDLAAGDAKFEIIEKPAELNL